MEKEISRIDDDITQLEQCKEILSVSLVDDQDAVNSLNQRIDKIITELKEGKEYIILNNKKMENAKRW